MVTLKKSFSYSHMRGSLLGQVQSKLQVSREFLCSREIKNELESKDEYCREKEGKGHFFSNEGWTRPHTNACFLISKKEGEANLGHVSAQLVSLSCSEIHFLCDFSLGLGTRIGEFDHCYGLYISEIICLCFVPFSVVTCNLSPSVFLTGCRP